MRISDWSSDVCSSDLLWQALDSMSEALAFYDSEERLVLYNSRYRELYPGLADALVPGSRFEDIMWMGLTRGLYLKAVGREEEWAAERLKAHRQPGAPLEQPLTDGRWVLIRERRTADGGTACIFTDINERKASEQALIHTSA